MRNGLGGRQQELPASEEMRQQGKWASRHVSEPSRVASSITVLMGTKCRSLAQTLNAASDKYPVYVQRVCSGNPEEYVRIKDQDAMLRFLPSESWWSKQDYTIVLPIKPEISVSLYEPPPVRTTHLDWGGIRW